MRIVFAESKVIMGYALVAIADQGRADRERRLAMLQEARGLFAEVSRFVDDVAAQPSLGIIPDHKLREFAAARARLDRVLAKVSAQ
jgi:hypothetical protein